MHIKKFNADDINEALRLIKAEFGGNAVILSTKSIKGRGVEVTAAADREAGTGYGIGAYRRTPVPGYEAQRGSLSTKTADPWEPRNLTNPEILNQKLSTPASLPAKGGEGETVPDLYREMRELKELVGSLVSHVHKNDFFGNNKNLSGIQRALVSAGVDETLSFRMLEFFSKKLSPEERADLPLLRWQLKQFIMRQISVAGIAENGHKPKVILFVGPTGVGKTTTIAKIAAINSINKKKKVALVTLDTYRIAAVEQLRVYARIMNIPLHVASTPEDLGRIVAGIQDMDLILVDTAGRSQKARAHMEELSRLYKHGESLETHLVISATAKERDSITVLKSYKDLPVDRLLFTKLDETTSYGGIFNVLMVSKKPVSYLTVGQKVPDDIEEATPEKIADLILSSSEIL